MTGIYYDPDGGTNADLVADSVDTRQTDSKSGIVNLLSPSGMNDNIDEINKVIRDIGNLQNAKDEIHTV